MDAALQELFRLRDVAAAYGEWVEYDELTVRIEAALARLPQFTRTGVMKNFTGIAA